MKKYTPLKQKTKTKTTTTKPTTMYMLLYLHGEIDVRTEYNAQIDT